MAKQISNIKRMEIPDSQIYEENMDDILGAVSENKDAILKGIELLSTLEESGLLDMLQALVTHKETAMENVFGQLSNPKYADILENMTKLILLAGKLNVADMEVFVGRINEGVAEAKLAQNMEKTSYTGILTALKDPEINRSITMMLQFLRGMGKE